MEQFVQQWGPAGFTLVMLGVIVNWLLRHIDKLTKVISNHITDSTKAQVELTGCIKDLKAYMKNGNK